MVILTIIGIAVGIIISRKIVKPLNQALQISNAVSKGHLVEQKELTVHGNDETAQIIKSMAEMQKQLRLMVVQVQDNALSVAETSERLESDNQDLLTRSKEQFSALQQTIAAIGQLDSKVQLNVDHACKADHLAQEASNIAIRGGKVVNSVVSTMKGINESSQRIADIIGVIDSIAFQTNILALNAAVEAARAGDQGRGFAVVASEVRNLAHRSASAAKEIKELIAASVERVETGSCLVDDAGQTMSEVVHAIQRVTSLMGEINAANMEQHEDVNQISRVVHLMDQSTLKNSELAEQSAIATQNMKQKAGQLVKTVSLFQMT